MSTRLSVNVNKIATLRNARGGNNPDIVSLVKKIDKELIKDVKIFDVYKGDNIDSGKKSIAFNVILEPQDKTLSEGDIDKISKKIISTVQDSTGATLRS